MPALSSEEGARKTRWVIPSRERMMEPDSGVSKIRPFFSADAAQMHGIKSMKRNVSSPVRQVAEQENDPENHTWQQVCFGIFDKFLAI